MKIGTIASKVNGASPPKSLKANKNGATTSRNSKANITTSSRKRGIDTSDDINLVTPRNSFVALNDENKILVNVVTSTARKGCD